jgi:hypothetical protein
MKLRTITWIIALDSAIFAGSVLAYDCNRLSQWKRQSYYETGTEVKYQEVAHENLEPSKHNFPDAGHPRNQLGTCDRIGGGGFQHIAAAVYRGSRTDGSTQCQLP